MDAVRTGDTVPAYVHIDRMRWWRGKVPIAITGTAGCGKTLMYDALLDKVGAGYVPKGRSADWERHRVKFRDRTRRTSASALVVPGQSSTERTRSLHQIFGAKRGPIGLIHVVCWGYNRRWQWDQDAEFEERAALLPDERRKRANEEVPEAIRSDNRNAELADFRELCQLLMLPGVRRRLQWLVIAVAKSDLYWSDLADTRAYYVPAPTTAPPGNPGESGFCRALRKLVTVDPAFPRRLAVLPFAGYRAPHDFGNGVVVRPQLSSQQVTSLRNNFRNILGGML